MSWTAPSSYDRLISIYKNNLKDRAKLLKKARRVKEFAEEVAVLDPDRLDYIDVLVLSELNRDYILFAKESELIRADIEAFLEIWLARKQDKSPIPREDVLEELL
jgi:hypothetical protein